MSKIVALLPMKGNSERVPNKNLKSFNGRPLFHWILDSLVNSNIINQVIINTDSELIKESALNFAKNEKLKILWRPENIQGDLVSMNDIIAYDLNQSDGDIYIQTHSTNPLLKETTINAGILKMIEVLKSQSHDSIFSVTKWQTRLYDKEGNAINHNPSKLLRTQDLEPIFEENSNFYIFTKESFFNNNSKRIGKTPYMFEVDKIESIDIDEPEDFYMAESIQRYQFKKLESNE